MNRSDRPRTLARDADGNIVFNLPPCPPEEQRRYDAERAGKTCKVCLDRLFVLVKVKSGNGAGQTRCTQCARGAALHTKEVEKAAGGRLWIIAYDPRRMRVHEDHDGDAAVSHEEQMAKAAWSVDSQLDDDAIGLWDDEPHARTR